MGEDTSLPENVFSEEEENFDMSLAGDDDLEHNGSSTAQSTQTPNMLTPPPNTKHMTCQEKTHCGKNFELYKSGDVVKVWQTSVMMK